MEAFDSTRCHPQLTPQYLKQLGARDRIIRLLQVHKDTIKAITTSRRKLQCCLQNKTIILDSVELAKARLRPRPSCRGVALKSVDNQFTKQTPPRMHQGDATVVPTVRRIILLVQGHHQHMVQHFRVIRGDEAVKQLRKLLPNSRTAVATDVFQWNLAQSSGLA